jgi:DNA-dependent RNA polymerase auxiliary subunit epsilon
MISGLFNTLKCPGTNAMIFKIFFVRKAILELWFSRKMPVFCLKWANPAYNSVHTIYHPWLYSIHKKSISSFNTKMTILKFTQIIKNSIRTNILKKNAYNFEYIHGLSPHLTCLHM